MTFKKIPDTDVFYEAFQDGALLGIIKKCYLSSGAGWIIEPRDYVQVSTTRVIYDTRIEAFQALCRYSDRPTRRSLVEG